MDKIIDTFRPWLDQTTTLDIVLTKMGWVMVETSNNEAWAILFRGENDLLLILTAVFVDGAEGDHHSRITAQMAREAMAPYLAQLTLKQVQRVDQALELYAKLDDI